MDIKPEEYGVHIARLNAESLQHRVWLERLQESQQRSDTQLMQLHASQTETKTLVTTLTTRFGEFEGRVFGVFSQMAADTAKLLQTITKSGQQERTQAQKSWVDFAKYTISATIGALVVYLFTKGGA